MHFFGNFSFIINRRILIARSAVIRCPYEIGITESPTHDAGNEIVAVMEGGEEIRKIREQSVKAPPFSCPPDS